MHFFGGVWWKGTKKELVTKTNETYLSWTVNLMVLMLSNIMYFYEQLQ